MHKSGLHDHHLSHELGCPHQRIALCPEAERARVARRTRRMSKLSQGARAESKQSSLAPMGLQYQWPLSTSDSRVGYHCSTALYSQESGGGSRDKWMRTCPVGARPGLQSPISKTSSQNAGTKAQEWQKPLQPRPPQCKVMGYLRTPGALSSPLGLHINLKRKKRYKTGSRLSSCQLEIFLQLLLLPGYFSQVKTKFSAGRSLPPRSLF